VVTPLPIGQEGARADIPWSDVGPGWLLAEFSAAAAVVPGTPSVPAPVSLYLVDPGGGRYLITTFPANTDNEPGDLVAWSGDGRRALFGMDVNTGVRVGFGAKLTELDLATATSHSFTVPGNVAAAGYTTPTGAAVVISVGTGFPTTLERLDRNGAVEVTYPTTFPGAGSSTGGFLYTPNGTQVVVGSTTGLELVANNGDPVAALAVPSGAGYCLPKAWWGSGTVLASCGQSLTRLWVVPLSGAPPVALTAPLSGQGPDLGDENAWQLPSGVFVQAVGACGYQYLARLRAGGTTNPVVVPGVSSGDSVVVVGAAGKRLAVKSTLACGPGRGLSWFDPAANTVAPLLGPPLSAGSVTAALLFPA
jgi:TolB protein